MKKMKVEKAGGGGERSTMSTVAMPIGCITFACLLGAIYEFVEQNYDALFWSLIAACSSFQWCDTMHHWKRTLDHWEGSLNQSEEKGGEK